MTETQFLMALSETTKAYKWTIDGKSFGGFAKNVKSRGEKFDPITAVCRSAGKGTYPSTARGKKTAAKKLGVDTTLTSSVSVATKATTNRGNGQVLRGKIRQVVGV